MTTISILGIDIAKNTFQLHGADKSGKALMANSLTHLSKDSSQADPKFASLDAYRGMGQVVQRGAYKNPPRSSRHDPLL